MTIQSTPTISRFTRRACLATAASVIAIGLTAGVSVAQEKFPDETIEVVTHAGAGGGTDVTTRMMMLRGRRELGVDMVVVNKRGGGGAVAMNYANGKDRDGYTIMTITPSHLMTIAMGKAPIGIDDLVGLARATDDPQLIMAKKGTFKDGRDMLDQAKQRTLKVAGTHVGGIDQVAVSTFANRAGIKINYIPYEGGGHIVTNLIGGDVDVGILNLSEAESQINAGEIQPLVVLAQKRMGPLPDVLTSVELGVDATFSTVRGFVTLKGVPEDRLKVLEEKLVKAMNHSVYQGYLETVGLGPDSIVGADEWTAQIRQLYADGETSLKSLGFIK